VVEFVEIHAFYLLDVGVDGLRIDTVKHVHHGFWDAFTERLRKRLGPAAKDKLIFGEVYDTDPEILGRYTWRSDWPARTDPGLDGVLNFQLCHAARDYLRQAGEAHGHAGGIEKAMETLFGESDIGRPLFNPNPGPDGRNSREKSITFIENHDALNRFRVAGMTAERSDLAQVLILSLPGIPCLYYGAEAALLDPHSRPGDQSESGRQTLFGRDRVITPSSSKRTASFRAISRMAALRRAHPALRAGGFAPLWVDSPGSAEDDGILAFTRGMESAGRVILIFNAAAAPRAPVLPGAGFPPGTRLAVAPLCGEGRETTVEVGADGMLRPHLAASSAVLLHGPSPPGRAK
jgi:glycosidase